MISDLLYVHVVGNYSNSVKRQDKSLPLVLSQIIYHGFHTENRHQLNLQVSAMVGIYQ